MSYLLIKWLEESAKNWTDIIPLEWLVSPPSGRAQHWFVNCKGYGLRQVLCRVEAKKGESAAIEIDYSREEDVEFNRTSGALIGMLTIQYEDPKNVRIFWQESSRRKPVSGKVEVVYSDNTFLLPEFASLEGRKRLVTHIVHERDPVLVKRKIDSVLLAKGGSLCCEVCNFNFSERYGELGNKFCEVHHVKPLAARQADEVKLEDLAIMCSNCHSMIHRTDPIEDIATFRRRWIPQK